MRNKKWNVKATAAVLVLAMAMAFTACGGDDAEKISGGITPAAVDEKNPEETDVTENQGVEEESGKTTSLGRVQGGMYVNEYMGISCNLDEGWEFYTAEELQEMPEDVAAMFEGTDVEEEMSQMNYITDMSAENAEELTNMNIIYEKMDLQTRLAFKSMTNTDIVDGMLTHQKDMLISTYAQAGINVQEMSKKTVNFCGEERDVLYMACDVSGVAYYAIQVFDYSLGEYSVTLTVTSFVEDKTEELLTLFSKYE